jgi:hypothetical protein
LAPTLLAALSDTVQVFEVDELQAPVQPEKVLPVVGVAVRVIWVPAVNEALQALLALLAEPLLTQLMPLGELATWPKPELLVTLSG